MKPNNFERTALQGENLLEQTINLRKRPQRIAKDFSYPHIQQQEVDSQRKYYCTCCGKSYTAQQGNFIAAKNSILWQGNNGYIPVCKTCVKAIYNSFVDFFEGNEEHALERMCQIFDLFYDEAASAMTLKDTHLGQPRIALYPSKVNTRQVAQRGQTYLDTIRADVANRHVIRDDEDMQAHVESSKVNGESGEFVVTDEMIAKWGYGYQPRDYQYLEVEEADWRSRVECKTKPQEQLIRSICLAQLQIRVAQLSGKSADVATAQKTYVDLLSAYNVLPKQNAVDDDKNQVTLGTLIKKWEEEEPIPEPDEEWKDVDGIQRYVDVYLYGHLANLAHLPNANEEAYRKEMEKYTVTPPSYEGDGDSIDDTSLVDKLATKGGGNK